MNFNKFGWYLVYLGILFGFVAGVFAYIPYNLRWEYAEAIMKSIRGDGAKLWQMQDEFATYARFKLGFGLGGAVTLFIGTAMIFSSKENSAENCKSCLFCKETIKLDALICKHCGKDQPPEDPNAKLHWTCPSCKAISRGHMTQCGVCDKPRPEDVVFRDRTKGAG